MLSRLARTPLALLNLLHQKARTGTALAGVSFACVLLSVQLGLYEAVKATATMLYDRLDFEVIILSHDYVDLNRARLFPEERLAQALEEPGVASATPIHVSANAWRTKTPDPEHRRNIMMVGFQPGSHIFREPLPVDDQHPQEFAASLQMLHRSGTVLIDRNSWREYGPQEPGNVAELGGSHVEIVGRFNIGTGFGYNGIIITSDQTFARSYGEYPPDYVTMGLLKLDPGADPSAIAKNLKDRLPPDVLVLTRSELEDREQQHWLKNTSIGVLVTFGLGVSLIVGTVFVYQVISSDITNRLKEFATLKAIGYRGRYLSKVVLQQALYLSIIGFIPGYFISRLLFQLTRELGHVPTYMSWFIALSVLGLTVGMCMVSALLALRKAHAADPADIF
jgi:putative ABC transport system permease protein